MIDFSIITATFNCESTIERSIDSLREQVGVNYQQIFIDGGSTDSTIKIIKEKIRPEDHLISEPDNGLYDAINKGIAVSSGSFLGLLHSDDSFDSPVVLKMLLNRFLIDKLDVVYGDLIYIKPTGSLSRYWISGGFSRTKLFYGWAPPHPAVFIRKSSFQTEEIFYSLRYKISSDYDWTLRIFSSASLRVGYLPFVITQMTTGGLSNSGFFRSITRNYEDLIILKRNFGFFGGIVAFSMKKLRKIPMFFCKGPFAER